MAFAWALHSIRLHRLLVAVAFTLVWLHPAMTRAGAPHRGMSFVNLAGARPMPPGTTMLSFFLRKGWTSLMPRSGAAPLVPFDPAAIRRNPSVTWIGHSTLLV